MQDLSTTTTGEVKSVPVASAITIGRIGDGNDWLITVRQHDVIELPDGRTIKQPLPELRCRLSKIIEQQGVSAAFEAIFPVVVAIMAGAIAEPAEEDQQA